MEVPLHDFFTFTVLFFKKKRSKYFFPVLFFKKKSGCCSGGGKKAHIIDMTEDTEDAGVDRRGHQVEKWMKTHFVRKISVSPHAIKEMPPALRVRQIYPEHVKRMMDLARKACKLNPNVKVVALDFQGNISQDAELVEHGLGCIEGNHSTKAAQNLHSMYPLNKRYATMQVEVYRASANSAEDRAMLRVMGSISNVKT